MHRIQRESQLEDLPDSSTWPSTSPPVIFASSEGHRMNLSCVCELVLRKEMEKITSMKVRNVLFTLVVILIGLAAFAQDYSKAEVAVFYSYARYNPSHAFVPNSYSLNGGGGSIDYNLSKYFGLKGEFAGYGSNTQRFSIPAGTPYCGGLACSGNAQANLFTYMFGPQVGLRSGKFRPFAHVLLGGAHSNGAANIYKATSSTGPRPSNDAFALAFGGGLDIPVNHSGSIAFRPADINYLWTNFNLNSHQSGQSNFQYKAGIVFNF
jgi:Outer membrane protein beta-barrel domain